MQRSELPPDLAAGRSDGEPRLLLLGIDHRSAPLELREKVAYSAEEGEELLRELSGSSGVAEVALLSTCNRTEVYLAPSDDGVAYRTALDVAFLRRAPEIGAEGRFYVKHGSEVVRHLLRVAGGLESMVLGEPEILGQVKRAAALANRARAGGPVLERLFVSASRGAARARRDTGISSGSVSFGYAVVDLARNIFQHLADCSILMIGAGETARQVARNLLDQGATSLAVANRSPERAEEFRRLFPTSTLAPWDDLPAAVTVADVVVASTGSPRAVLGRGELARAMAARSSRPLLLVDLGVPRNVDSEAGELANVFLQDIDSLEQLIGRNLRKRREEIPRAEEILEDELVRFERWAHGLHVEPVVATLQRRAEAVRRETVDAVRDRFPPETQEELDRLTRALVKRILHHPSTSLRRQETFPRAGESSHPLDVVRRLFRLHDEEDAEDDGDPSS